MKAVRQFRFGFKFSKLSPLHFIGHLDLMRLLERAARRAGLPVAFSEGYNPHPRISLAQPLAVGMVSSSEYGEIFLTFSLPPETILKSLNEVLPPEVQVERVFLIPAALANLTVLTDVLVYEGEFGRDDSGNVVDAETVKKNIGEFLSGTREVRISLMRKGQPKEFILNSHDYIFDFPVVAAPAEEQTVSFTVILKIKYHEGVPLHAREIISAAAGFRPEKITRKEIIFKFNFKS